MIKFRVYGALMAANNNSISQTPTIVETDKRLNKKAWAYVLVLALIIVVSASSYGIYKAKTSDVAFKNGNLKNSRSSFKLIAIDHPYFRVYGGDVAAGSEFKDTSGTCPSPPGSLSPNAGIVGWENSSTGTDMAAQAMDEISGFQSNYSSGGGGNYDDLIFSNTIPSVSIINGKYGGDFGRVPCTVDYSLPARIQPWPDGNLNFPATYPGDYLYSGASPLVINAAVFAPFTHVTLFVKKGIDVVIDGNITYSPVWATFKDIPSFKLVVQGGDIIINNGVTEINGSYVAQPIVSGTISKGNIFTCAKNGIPYSAPFTSWYSDCNKQLFIDGDFVARQVIFERSFGGAPGVGNVGQTPATSDAGEVFTYGPEIWLAEPSSWPPVSNAYDYLTGLPPIL
jgi:hypothetical protein